MDKENLGEYSDDVYSKSIKAGKRTYFLDIKTTKSKDHFLTITESKKVIQNGNEYFQKHKIFLYKEDFDRFSEALQETIEKARSMNQGNGTESTEGESINFEDLK